MAEYEIKDGVGIIPEGTTEIADSAFKDCTELTSVIIPNSVTKIGSSAFEGCTALTSIVIPDSVSKIGSYAFYDCTGLTSIVVSEGNKTYDSRDNCNALIETATNTMVCGCGTTIIPSSVTVIGSSAFRGHTNLTDIVIPKSVTIIGSCAFKDCTSLTGIKIPNGVTEIHNNAFEGFLVNTCKPFTNLYFKQRVVTTIGVSILFT